MMTSALIAAGGALIGAAGSAYNRKQARDRQNAYYDYAGDLLNSQYYQDPFSTIGGRAMVKYAKQNAADAQEAIDNRMVAGGATMENALAARQANNENLDKVGIQLLQADDTRRRGVQRDMLSLAGQRANAEANSYLQAAQDWQSWGSSIANAALSYGSSTLLGGGELSAKEWAKSAPGGDALAGMAARIDNADNPIMQPVLESYSEALGGGMKPLPRINGDPKLVPTPGLGGLKGV